ncbi:MAG: hypothetical protein R3E41_06580 [Burkholderiaceae bacterium]|jgi:hypothetical protein|nr:hypothetical protein [Burkholderiaceae bacterium]
MSSMHSIVRRLALGGEPAVLREELVFIKTRIGRDEARRTDSSIPRRLRTLLALVDGRRSVGELRAAIHSYRGLDDALDMLRKMGFIEPLPERWDIG